MFLLSTISVQGQVLRFGPKVGLQATRTIFDETASKERYSSFPSLAFHAGAMVNIKASELFSLQTELLYHQTRKHIENKAAGDWQKETYEYLSLPLLLRFSYPWKHNELYVNAGPSVSYWLAGKGKVFHSEVFEFELDILEYEMAFDGNEDTYRYIIEEPNRLQLGLDIGAGAILPLGPNYLMVDLRYTFGHTNMAKGAENYLPLSFYEEDLLHTQQVLSLSVAYLINFDFYTMRTKGKSSGRKTE